uniref:Uncharacterized protein n=1 Tax=Neovison vison TaxID=452646 RepID=A0A8C7ADL9_NEOVI
MLSLPFTKKLWHISISKDWTNMQQSYTKLFLDYTTGASFGTCCSQMMQGMVVSAQSTPSGHQSQSMSGYYKAGSGGINSMSGDDKFCRSI